MIGAGGAGGSAWARRDRERTALRRRRRATTRPWAVRLAARTPHGAPGTLAAVTTKRALVLAGGGLGGHRVGDGHSAGHRRRVARRRRRRCWTPTCWSARRRARRSPLSSAAGSASTRCSTARPTPSSTELNPGVGIDEITELFVAAMMTARHDQGREAAEDRRGRAVDRHRRRTGAARRDRAPAAVARLAGPGAADHRDRHRHRRAGRRSTGRRASASSTRSPPAARCPGCGRR